MTVRRMGVVLPASNEAASLPALLASLLAQEAISLEVVVVANGCADSTAAIAREHGQRFAAAGHDFRVLETPRASKAAALRLGDAAIATLPRAYVDADVVLTPRALADVAAALNTTKPRAAAPRLAFAAPPDTAGLAAFVESTPPFSDDVVGGGFYAVNGAGRARWGEFPDLIADDAFVLGRFARSERVRVGASTFWSRFPDRLRLPAVLARWEYGRRQAAQGGWPGPKRRRISTVLAILRRPTQWAQAWRWLRLKRAARAEAGRRSAHDESWARA